MRMFDYRKRFKKDVGVFVFFLLFEEKISM